MAATSVVFHCPACGDDRLGEPRRGRWSSWLRDDNGGGHLVCVGCRGSFHGCAVAREVTRSSYRARANRAVRAMAATVYLASDGDPRVEAAAVEFVRSCTTLHHYDRAQLRADISRGVLEHRLRGELTLLARDLETRAALQLVVQLRKVVEAGSPGTLGQAIVADCARYLGVGATL